MKYSVLKSENGILTYRQAPEPMPSGVGMDSVRDFLFWQNQLKIYSIKNEDLPQFEKFIQTAQSGGDGYLIPHELVKIFKDADGRECAKISSDVVYDAEKGGIYALNHNCSICGMTWAVEVGTEKSPLPFCTSCTESLKELVLNNKKKESYGS